MIRIKNAIKSQFIHLTILFIFLFPAVVNSYAVEKPLTIDEYFDKLGNDLFENGFWHYQLYHMEDYLFIAPLAFDSQVVPASISSTIDKKLQTLFLEQEFRFSDSVKVIDDKSNPKKRLTLNGEIKREQDDYHVTVYLIDDNSQHISQAETRIPISLFQERKLTMTIYDPTNGKYQKDDPIVKKTISNINKLLLTEGFRVYEEKLSTGFDEHFMETAKNNEIDFLIRFSLTTTQTTPVDGPLAVVYSNIQISAFLPSTGMLLSEADGSGKQTLISNATQDKLNAAFARAAAKAVKNTLPKLLPLLKQARTGG